MVRMTRGSSAHEGAVGDVAGEAKTLPPPFPPPNTAAMSGEAAEVIQPITPAEGGCGRQAGAAAALPPPQTANWCAWRGARHTHQHNNVAMGLRAWRAVVVEGAREGVCCRT